VPRFVKSDDYASRFGLQWNRYSEVQLDSRNNTHFSRDRFYAITEWLPPTLKEQLVLDVGCGAGRFAEVALNDGAEVIGVDLSSAVDAAYKNLGEHPRFHCLQASAHDLPLADATFDYTYCIGVIQHTPDPEERSKAFFQKSNRAAKWPYGFTNSIGKHSWERWALSIFYARSPGGGAPRRLEAFSSWLEPLFWPVTRRARQTGVAGKVLMRMLPVSSAHLHKIPLSERHFREWVRLDTFDMYSPARSSADVRKSQSMG
jgi:SAM-dependent methyltransferase